MVVKAEAERQLAESSERRAENAAIKLAWRQHERIAETGMYRFLSRTQDPIIQILCHNLEIPRRKIRLAPKRSRVTSAMTSICRSLKRNALL